MFTAYHYEEFRSLNVAQSNARFSIIGPDDIKKCPRCPTNGLCRSLYRMIEQELSYHVVFPLTMEAFEHGEFISFPHAIPSTKLSNKDLKSNRGPFLIKERYGMVVALFEHFMEVGILATSNGSCPSNKPPAKRVKCFGIKEEGSVYQIRNKKGRLVTFEPEQGTFDAPSNIEYRVVPGINGDVTNKIRVEYSTRV